MRVIRVIPSFYPIVTGPANAAFNISKEMEKNHIKSPIITTTFELKKEIFKEKFENVTCLRFKPVLNFYQYSITPQLIPFLLKTKCDLIHAHSYRNFQSDIAYLMSKLKKIPFIITPHGQAFSYLYIKNWQIFRTPYKLYDIFTFRHVLKNANAIVACSKQELDELKKLKIDERKIKLIPEGINIEFPKKLYNSRQNNLTKLLFVGRISRNRRIELILSAFRILLKKYQKLELWIIGGEERTSYTQLRGYLNELKDLSQKLKLDKKVHFTGYLPYEELKKFYSSSDIFVYTSDYENFGQAILEAAAAGLPLICSSVGIAPEIIKEGKTGFLIKNNSADIANKIEYLIENEKERVMFGNRIRKYVEKNYKWENIAKIYVKLYKMLI